jgi:3-deoxy-manno-octulosonate cytidylyltransferase (CMP-KDO synthetase)
MNNVTIIIPARYDSTRFPGKPLALINNKPMILHVCDGCAPAFGKDKVVVTTDDDRISDVVTNAGYNVVMTRKDQVFHTGMDRVSYASKFVESDYIINVQGDEPLVCAEDIVYVYEELQMENLYKVINCFKVCNHRDYGVEMVSSQYDGGDWISKFEFEFENTNTIKVIEDAGSLIYMSRQPIPIYCDNFKKQVCIYGFKKSILTDYYGENKCKRVMEDSENIEILRVLAGKRYRIEMLEVKNEYQSVDVPEDIEKVERILNDRN